MWYIFRDNFFYCTPPLKVPKNLTPPPVLLKKCWSLLIFDFFLNCKYKFKIYENKNELSDDCLFFPRNVYMPNRLGILYYNNFKSIEKFVFKIITKLTLVEYRSKFQVLFYCNQFFETWWKNESLLVSTKIIDNLKPNIKYFK